jgi:hypothetical protein
MALRGYHCQHPLTLKHEGYPDQYNSGDGKQFIVAKPDKDVVFKQSPAGLYYHDTSNRNTFIMVNTIKENREGFTTHELEKVKEVRRARALGGYSPPKDVMNMVISNIIKNCRVSLIDISNAHKIFGPDIATMKGKKVQRMPEGVMTYYVHVLDEIISINKNVMVTADNMFMCGLTFLVSISRKIKFITIQYLPGRSQTLLVKSLKHIFHLSAKRGFKVETALMDREFECLRVGIQEVNLNTTTESKHVPKIRHQIRVIKERTRAIRSALPFKRL